MNTEPEKPQKNEPDRKLEVRETLELLSMQALRKGGIGVSGLPNFTEKQVDRSLDLIKQNEENAFKYHTKKLDALKEIELARINAGTIEQKNSKWLILGLLLVLPAITIVIIFFKEDFFVPWLTFLTGSFGGYGVGKATDRKKKNTEKNESPIDEDV